MIFDLLRNAYDADRRLVFLIVVLSVLCGMLESGAFAFLAPLMAILTGTPPSAFRWPLSILTAAFGWATREQMILIFSSLLAVVMLLRFAAITVTLWLITEIEVRLVRSFREQCVNVLFFAPQSFLDSYDNARITQHFNEQSLRAGEALRTTLRALTSVVTFCLNLIVLAILSVPLMICAVILVALLSVLLSAVPRIVAANAKRFVKAAYDYNVRLGDLIGGIKTIRSYATFNKEYRLLIETLKRQINAHKRKIFFSSLTTPIFEVLGYITLCLILVCSVFILPADKWLVILAPFVAILSRTIPQASILNGVRSTISLHGADYAALKDFIANCPAELTVRRGTTIEFRELELKDVSFGYVPGKPVIERVCMTIHRGQRVLLVGPSGAGKSTLLNLILGLYHPNEGTIRINGNDLASIDTAEWTKRIGIVEQAPFIFNDTILNNVAYKDDGVAESEILRAIRTAGLTKFVNSLEAGLNTELGDGGCQLSGGQRQRLSFARALCHSPELLILDEPTSALDRETEAKVLAALKEEYPSVTVIAVSHSEAMHKLFDTVYRIDKGRMAEEPASRFA